MLSRVQRKRLQVILLVALFSIACFVYLHRRSTHNLYDETVPDNMLSAAKKQAVNRQATRNIVRIDSDDFGLPEEAEIAKASKFLDKVVQEKSEKKKKLAELEQSETPVSQPEPLNKDIKHALDHLIDLLKQSTDKIDELSSTVEGMRKRLRVQEDSTVELESIMKSRLMFIAEKQEDILKQTTAITKKGEVPFYRTVKFAEPPVSTVSCFGNSTSDRVCKVKNLCYDPPTDKFFIFKDPNSLELNTPKNRSYLVDTTSIDGHNRFFFDYQEVHPDRYEQRTFRLVEKLSFMISRFHVYNIMHTVHDDFIGLYLLHRMFAPNNDEDPSYSFSQDNNIFFVDSFANLRYDYIFQLLSRNPIQFRENYRTSKEDQMPICFRDAIVGNSKHGSWYTYGFFEPQGPIANKTVSGLMIREVASYLIKRFHLPLWNENSIRGVLGDLKDLVESRRRRGTGRRDALMKSISDHHFITIFSRKLDRLILNEAELAKDLARIYGLEVRYVRIEDMHLMEQITILKNTVIAMGMHGSALILSMFLPPGALLIEFFPYRVPAENYTPYKTLCGLPGIRLAYRSWTNTHQANNVAHPEKPPNGGGIKHLSEEEQKKIVDSETVAPHLCCADPTWLFRIYQDTRVETEEVFDLIDDGILEGAGLVNTDPGEFVYIRPSSIDNMYCKVARSESDPEQLDLSVSWTQPWNGVKPDFYGIWVHQNFAETTSNNTDHTFTNCTAGQEYDMWVRPYSVDRITDQVYKGAYSDKFTCTCALDTEAVKGKLENPK